MRNLKNFIIILVNALFVAILLTQTASIANASTNSYPLGPYLSLYTPGDTLISTNGWCGRSPYNGGSPVYVDNRDEHVRLGCWTVAIGQILNYYQLQSNGKIYYECEPDTIIDPEIIDHTLDDHVYYWSLMMNEVTNSSPINVKENVSKFLYDVACVIQKNFGHATPGYFTLKGCDKTKSLLTDALLNHFDFISYQTEWTDNLSEAHIINEINHKRPIMLYIDCLHSPAHAIVLDGYKYSNTGLVVHLNYGWRNHEYDGWYLYRGDIPSPDPNHAYCNPDYRKALLIRVQTRTPSLLKIYVMTKLTKLRTGNAAIDGWLDDAANDILQSLSNDYWIDDWYLESSYGDRVFEYAETAAAKLTALSKITNIYFGKELIHLVFSDRLLAYWNIHKAKSIILQDPLFQPLVDELIAKAESQLNYADKKVEIDDYCLGIWHCENAWKYAEEALKYENMTSSGAVDVMAILSEIEKEFEISPDLRDFNLEQACSVLKSNDIGRIQYALKQNYPNPFNPETLITYELPEVSQVTIQVFDVLGRHITTLVNEKLSAGTHSVSWTAKRVPSGTYLCRMRAVGTETSSEFIAHHKMLLMR